MTINKNERIDDLQFKGLKIIQNKKNRIKNLIILYVLE